MDIIGGVYGYGREKGVLVDGSGHLLRCPDLATIITVGHVNVHLAPSRGSHRENCPEPAIAGYRQAAAAPFRGEGRCIEVLCNLVVGHDTYLFLNHCPDISPSAIC
ncbi:hypothetical protein ES705_49209 [subsurface metagenome]